MALESVLCYNPSTMANNEYLPTIGLEIHAELNTKTKMFCSSKNDASEKRPNSNVCPVCMAHPGTLPVINKAAVEHVLRVGAALGAQLADYTEFDRKNYFYPDLPKGYQLSQFEFPLVSGGILNGVQLTRIHLEEDTASSVHDENTDATLVDYNRAGVPLMELVTEPVLHTAQDAGNFGRELQLLLRYLGASEADMEKGQMRLEANISVAKIKPSSGTNAEISTENNATGASSAKDRSNSPTMLSGSASSLSSLSISNTKGGAGDSSDAFSSSSSLNTTNAPRTPSSSQTGQMRSERIDLSQLGTKVEVKNINSFRAMERAIEFEVKRQIALLERGEKVVQETRGWDENKQQTFSQRIKEGSADYRYFPDPDLPSLKLSELALTIDTVSKTLPELPWQRRERYKAQGISTQDVELYVKDSLFGGFFEEVEKVLSSNPAEVKLASNYIANDLVKLVSDIRDNGARGTQMLDEMPISAQNFSTIIKMISAKKLSSKAAKELLAICIDGVSDPEETAKEKGLLQQEMAAGQIEAVIQKILADNPNVVADFKAGKGPALEYLVGQGMKTLRGAADPMTLRDLIHKSLS
jgi:aspartyl-tRNA(Asn)/glutamyl-tRNA(Gln) amidotransferase subunit B